MKIHYPAALALISALLSSFGPLGDAPLRADEVVNGNCLTTVSGSTQNCTANDGPDLTLGITSISDITAGCINNTSSVELVKFQIILHQPNAGTRYDVGTWINSDGSSANTGPNGTCSRFGLFPAGTLNANTCGPWDLDSGSGPYVNADGDSCGDLYDAGSNGCNQNSSGSPWDDSVYNTVNALGLTVLCSDPASTGFVRVPTCNTWSQQANAVDDPADAGNSCDSAAEFGLGTTAKCSCGTEDTNVPAPNLGLSCTCSPSTVRVGFTNGASTTCTVTYNNAIDCVPNASTAENLRCGTAAYVQYQVDENTSGTGGDIGQFLSNLPNTPTENTSGKIPTSTTSQIRWTPRNQITSGSLGIIGDNQTGTLTFQYYVDPSTATLTNRVIANVSTYFSNAAPDANGAYASRVLRNGSAQCTISTSPNATWARVSSFAAKEDDGRVVVEWETAAEVGTVAFEVERRDPASGQFVRISEQAVPAVEQLPGGRYRLVDPAAPRGQKLTYRLVEIDQQGKREVFGPYRVKVERESRQAQSLGDRDFKASGKAVSPRLLEAAVERRSVRAAADAAVVGEKAQAASRARISVVGSGMVRVKKRDLAIGLGMPVAAAAGQIKSGRLQLSHAGQNVAWQAAADGDGIVFYGEAIDSPYTDANVYWLERGNGQLVATVAAQPASGAAADAFLDTRHIEVDAIPAVTAPLPVADFWIWKSFFPGFPGFDRGTFIADAPSPAAGQAKLTVNLYGFAAVQRASLRVNGRGITEISWSGPGPFSRQVTLPAGLLVDGANNKIEIVALEAERGFWLDSFDLTYSRHYRAVSDRLAFRAEAGRAVALDGFRSTDITVYDLAQPLAPRRLGGLNAQPQADGTWGVSFLAPDAGPYVATTGGALGRTTVEASSPADLRNPGRGAEYLVITPPELRSEARRLADLRAGQGLTTMVVDLGDVVDLFGDGIPDPLAIRRFLAYAVDNWSTPPRYVVLAGKGTYDYRNLLGLFSNLLPPLLVTTSEGISPADAEFADFDDSGVPAVAIGRIPAVTLADMRAYVDKVAAYESEPAGAWTGQALLVADDADSAGDFQASSEALAGLLAPRLGLSRIYMPVGATSEQIQENRSRLQGALREGQLLVNYIGHGGLDRLDSEGLLLTSDVPKLGNAPRLPVMTALTCLISQFAYPAISSLGEELVLQRDGGTAALFGPTWLSYNAPAGELGRYLLPQLSQPDNGRLGDRLLRGLAAYAAAGGDRDMLRLYTLLGDPALNLKR
ncbi:MAG TPA: C25 family cysteine peptidase [Thermoanaerobaculia bacterium]|nr:C25 family cysteine peptidase [Thermoanaerobaculia bacterium]